MPKVYFIDYEASSLSDASYPISVGLVSLDLPTGIIQDEYYSLIKPRSNWTDWNAQSEGIHKIPRQRLLDEGVEPHLVKAQMDALIPQKQVFSDAPAWDGMWNLALFTPHEMSVVSILAFYQLPCFDHLTDAQALDWCGKMIERMKSAKNDHNHNALDDARGNAEAVWEISKPVLEPKS